MEAFFRDTLKVDLTIDLRYAPTYRGAVFDRGHVIYGDGFARVDAIAHAVSHSLVRGDSAEAFCDVVGSIAGDRPVTDSAYDDALRVAAETLGAGSAAQLAAGKSRLAIREYVPPAAGAEVPQIELPRKPPRKPPRSVR